MDWFNRSREFTPGANIFQSFLKKLVVKVVFLARNNDCPAIFVNVFVNCLQRIDASRSVKIANRTILFVGTTFAEHRISNIYLVHKWCFNIFIASVDTSNLLFSRRSTLSF